jgi:hypothetical protein
VLDVENLAQRLGGGGDSEGTCATGGQAGASVIRLRAA